MSNSNPIPVVYPIQKKKSPVTCTQHLTCIEAAAAGACLSAFILPTTKHGDEHVVLVGKETSGNYQGKFNMIGGKGDPCDNGCLIECLRREVAEEGKIDLTDDAIFEKHMRDPVTGKLRVLYVGAGKTPVFVGDFPALSCGPINQKIAQDNQNPALPDCHKELEQVQWVNVSDAFTQPNGKTILVSYFAQEGIKHLRDAMAKQKFVIQ